MKITRFSKNQEAIKHIMTIATLNGHTAYRARWASNVFMCRSCEEKLLDTYHIKCAVTTPCGGYFTLAEHIAFTSALFDLKNYIRETYSRYFY